LEHEVWLEPARCAKNVAECGIDFADGVVGFADPAGKVVKDTRKDYGEARYNMLKRDVISLNRFGIPKSVHF